MILENNKYPDCFIRFNNSIEAYSLPEKFNYPHNYTPHPLCKLAADELQQFLETQRAINHDFGIEKQVDGTNIGKMFGVLLVKTVQNEIGYLAAYSGKLGGRNDHKGFVPPIVDLLREDGFYRIGEEEINQINRKIWSLEQSETYRQTEENYTKELYAIEQQLEQQKQAQKEAKANRAKQREEAREQLSDAEFEALTTKLNNQSAHLHYDQKQVTKALRLQKQEADEQYSIFKQEIEKLKELRKAKSAALQQEMFDRYQFLNYLGKSESVFDIFSNTDLLTPPSGAGDCAAPKLLNYAYQHNLKPLSMAEFWWGQSPKSEIRKHGYFYPACKSKCEPILRHMLTGLQVDENPIKNLAVPTIKPEIIFQDEAILVISKPEEYLSVPGKSDTESVFSYFKAMFPEAEGPLIVHRLDMSTSGLMVLAKTWDAYHALQNQFMERTIKKHYIALLEGIIETDEGTIDLPLRVDLDNRPRQLVCFEYGKPSLTRYKVIDRTNGQTRVRFFPITGRTHQLRVHAAHSLGLNCPIVGDDLYGYRGKRLCLHAEYLAFVHPTTNKKMSFSLNAAF